MLHKSKFHGITSLMLVDLSIILAIYAISLEHVLWAVIYAAYVFLAFGLVIYIFCRKCTTRHDCSHYFLGQITRLMPPAKETAYKKSDFWIVIILLLPVFTVPVYWLLKLDVLPYIYFGLVLIAGLQVNRFVCPNCKNYECAMLKNGACGVKKG